MEPGQDLAGDLSEPEEGVLGHRAGELAAAALGLLADQPQDARGVDDPDEAAVEPQADGPAEPLLVAVEQGTRVGDAVVKTSGGHDECVAPRDDRPVPV